MHMYVCGCICACVCVCGGGGVKGEGGRGDVGKVCLCTDLGVLATFSVEICFESKCLLYIIYTCVCACVRA